MEKAGGCASQRVSTFGSVRCVQPLSIRWGGRKSPRPPSSQWPVKTSSTAAAVPLPRARGRSGEGGRDGRGGAAGQLRGAAGQLRGAAAVLPSSTADAVPLLQWRRQGGCANRCVSTFGSVRCVQPLSIRWGGRKSPRPPSSQWPVKTSSTAAAVPLPRARGRSGEGEPGCHQYSQGGGRATGAPSSAGSVR